MQAARVNHALAAFASEAMVELWTEKWVARHERELWLHVMRLQYEAGVFDHIADFPRKLNSYRLTANDVRLWVIQDIERQTKHDLKARVQAYNQVASQWYGEQIELIHWGMTSADVVDNMALMRMRRGLDLLRVESDFVPFRGIKGPVGTQQDMLDLLGTPEAVAEFDKKVAEAMGFSTLLQNVGQMSHRSIDHQVATEAILSIKGAQPWHTIARGYMTMIEGYMGDTWNEGDVMSSSVRRVALPGVFLAASAAQQERIAHRED